jgi:nucleotide-binding universal stress UspA family protein
LFEDTMPTAILTAVDLGPGGERVLAGAAALARMLAVPLHVRSVVEQDGSGAAAGSAAEAAEESLAALVRRVTRDDGAASVRVLTGSAAPRILEAARDVRADVIVIGPHAGRDPGAAVFGTTADRIVREATVPCLVLHGTVPAGFRRIVVPTDFSANADGALRAAARWARVLGNPAGPAELHVLYAGPHLERPEDRGVEEAWILPELESAKELVLLAAPGLAVETHVTWTGRPAESIVEWAAAHGADLIVAGTRGASAVRRIWLGSTAGSVARRAQVPVLLVPPTSGADAAHPALDCLAIGIDFGAASVGAAEWSMHELAPAARHVLVHVAAAMDMPAYAADARAERERLRQEDRARAGAELRDLFPATGAGERMVVHGRAADELARTAAAVAANIIVVGAHLPTRGAPAVLGTTAEDLIRASPVPVLVVRGRPATPPRRVLAAVDASDHARDVLAWARLLTDYTGAALHVVHVLDARYLGAARSVSGMRAARELPASYEAQAGVWLGDVVTHAGIEPGAAELHVVPGAPAQEVLALQQRLAADLIVIGSRGAGAIGRMLIGTVAGSVVRGAACAVLVVREPDE